MVAARVSEPVKVGTLLSASLRAWRRQVGFLTVIGALVLAPVVLGELAWSSATGELVGTDDGFSVSYADGVVALLGLLTHHFLTGVMESVEGAERHGHPRPTLGGLVRALPWGRLVAASILVNAAVTAGLAVLVVPGLAVAVYTAVALPLLNMERRPVVATIRRSARLVRGHELAVLALLALTTVTVNVVREAVAEAAEALTHSHAGEFVGHLAAEVLTLPLASLPIVMLAFALVAADRGPDRPS